MPWWDRRSVREIALSIEEKIDLLGPQDNSDIRSMLETIMATQAELQTAVDAQTAAFAMLQEAVMSGVGEMSDLLVKLRDAVAAVADVPQAVIDQINATASKSADLASGIATAVAASNAEFPDAPPVPTPSGA